MAQQFETLTSKQTPKTYIYRERRYREEMPGMSPTQPTAIGKL